MRRFFAAIIGAILLLGCEKDADVVDDTCLVKFDVNGAIYESTTVAVGSKVGRPADPEIDGYTFDDWYYMDSESMMLSLWDFNTSITTSMTLYGKFSSMPIITFNSNGGSSVNSQTIDYNTAVSEPADPTLDGCTFVGWYSNATRTKLWDFTTQVTESMTLYAKWSGSMNIYEEADCIIFREIVNNGYGDLSAKLMNDIDLNNNAWTPIGTSNFEFTGVFDGNNYSISGLYINSSSDYQGLFGYTSGATISNLTISSPSVKGASYVGAIVSYAKSSSISDCAVVDGSVTGSSSYVGGITGYSTSSITSCYNTGTVKGSSTYVGGVTGYSTSSIASCYNTGTVKGSSTYVGGVTGYSTSSIASCYNTGSVEGSGNYVGGVTGYSTSSITSCYNTGTVKGSSTYVGGVAGYSTSSITSCYNTESIEGSSNVGGVVGRTYSSSYVTACYNTGSVSGSSYAGGIVGYIYSSSSIVTACYNVGSVVGSGSYIGGVAGRASSSSCLVSCYYIDQLEDDTSYGVGGGANSNATAVGYSTLNSSDVIDVMNAAIANRGYSGVKYTAGIDSYLPNLMGETVYSENIKYDGYIGIYNALELSYIGTLSTYPLDGNYLLVNDITLSGEWTPIGTSSTKYFSGTFDGGGHTISGLTINSTSSYIGLFGYTRTATVKDIIIKEPSVCGGKYTGALIGYDNGTSAISGCGIEGGSVTGCDLYVGGMVGCAYQSSITSCYNTGSVEGSSLSVGGIAGGAYRSPIASCYNTGDISGSGYVGGVVGDPSYSSSGTTVTDCYNTGSVSGSGDYVGGVVGYLATVTDCYNTGSVLGASYVGGVLGRAYYSVTSCYNTGSVVGSGDYVGGVVGYALLAPSSPVTSCYNIGDVSGGGDSVGGVVGYTSGFSSVISCYNIGDVSGGGDRVGGVVGYAESSVKSCYNIGDVSGDNSYIGGVVGYASSSITSCYYYPSSTSYTNTYGSYSSSLISTMTSSAIITTLNTAADGTYWEKDSSPYVNDGYPILVGIDY